MSNGVEVLVKDKNTDGKYEQTKYMEVKTIQPSSPTKVYMSSFPKADKRIDNEDESPYDLIQPSEVSHASCTTSCSCSSTKTEGLQTKYPNRDVSMGSYNMKTSKYGSPVLDLRPTNKEQLEKKTQYGPYEYETSSQVTPTDRIVEKYTEVINDYSDEKDSSVVNESELLTNEQAPTPTKTNKVNNKTPEKSKPDKQKPNKNKFVVADLLKLGTLGIKGLTQLAPVIEKMTGGFIKRQETTNKVTTTTIKPAVKLTAYNVDKRVDSEMESKHNNFPIYIPVDELETSESQMIYTNATLHQNLVWAAEHKQPKAHIVPPKIIHESPLVNGGIPISPGEIITANSDVIVGKPAVGGPLTLAASGIKLQNPVSPPPIDSFVAANEQYLINEKPLSDQGVLDTKVDDSYDLRPPGLPNMKPKPNRPLNAQRPSISVFGHQNKMPPRLPPTPHISSDQLMKTEHIKSTTMVLGNHGRPAFLDYIPSLAKPVNTHIKHHVNFKPVNKGKESEVPDNSPSSSEIVNTQIRTEDEYGIAVNPESNKPFLVDIQPSRVANVLIPHGSSTALVFAGSSEPHKTGDYVDDPLPYPEPGYFGSFSIDAPQMTNVHNVAPNSNKQYAKPNFNNPQDHYKPNIPPFKEHSIRNDLKIKWKDNKRPGDYNRIPPPTSNQETHVQVGPQITSYNPDIFSPTNGDFDKYNKVKGNDKPKDGKKIIDKEYENYLAVPPPPPKMIFNQDNSHDKLKPYQQRPIVHTKPVQDMKVFLNIQHPVPQEQMPPKVTSEIYFAAQAPNNKPSPTYTIHIPPAKDSFVNTFNKPTNNIVSTPMHTDVNQAQNHFSIVSSPNIANTSQITHNDNDKENTYTVTLNTATNVASNVGEVSQVIGSSVPVPIGSTNVGLNTDIPIGINFAIRVEDNRPSLETYNLQEDQRKPIVYDEHGRVPINVSVEDNRWNTSSIEKEETTIVGHNYYHQNVNAPPRNDYNNRPIMPPSLNSHANFPMMNEDTTAPPKDLKPVVEYMDDVKFTDQKRPAKLIPNIPTNSHGWYSSVLNENNINQIKVEATTRKVIPIHDYNEKDSIPDFGEKITSAGKPPTEIWTKNQHILPNFNIGKPFTKVSTIEKTYSSIPPLTTKPYASNNYIPSNLNAMQQPAYDIPIRDNSDETTTSTQKPKPVYENSEEVYDGEEEQESTYDTDGAISLESMKIPVVSSEVGTSTSTEITLLQDEVLNNSKENHNNKLSTFNPGTQTEKPFRTSNNTSFQSNAIKPVYANNYYNMKPRPFTVNTALVLDHQLQQPHWQINHMMENSSNASYEENIDLNIGEEMNAPSTTKPSVQRIPLRQPEIDDKYTQSFRPVFTRTNGTQVLNESNIITSTVHIKDKKPLIVEKATEKSTMPTFTIRNEVEFNKTSSEIVDLSPPPPTMDYNFKPSTNDEMIMGMSPPPPRNTPAGRPPVRVPLTPRPIPVRTPPSYRPKPQRTLPPRLPTQRPVRKPARDEVSTYRPHVRDDAHTHRPIRDEVSTYRPLLPSKPTSTIRPTRTLARPDIVYPTRHTSIKKIVRPIPTRLPPVVPPSIIESSESAIDEELIRPTEVLRDSVIPTPQIEISGVPEPSSTLITPTLEVNISPIVQPVHHAGNEIKISDETIPTKTEFRTTVITLTKTLSEPPTTISSVDYVNLTHTLTVTHTKTSLVSQSDGAVTETLVLTNTQTSTIVDVVTEIRTQVQPTTIIETVTKHIPVPQVEPTPVQEIKEKTKEPLDDISMSSEENDNLIIRDNEVTENVQKIEVEGENDNDTFFVVMNKSQNGGQSPPVNTEVETGDYDGITRNEQVNSNGVSQVLFGEILLAGAPYLETTNVGNANGYGKECHPDCKASRNERCQRIDGIMKCVCRPGFARMFPDRPCKPTYTYSVKLALDSQGSKRLRFHQNLSDNSSKEYQALAVATHEGINRMVMQSDLRDVFHGVHITGFHPVEMKESGGDLYQGVMNHFYVQLSDNAHESRLKEVIEKYLRNNNYSLGGTDVHAAGELVDRLDVSDFDECTSVQFHDCSEHAQCFNLRGTYTCSCLEGYADLSVNNLYPGRICSTEPVGCERCNYHGACYSRDDRRVLCECFQWYAGSTCQINLKVVLISLVVAGAVLTAILTACAIVACRRSRPPQRSIVACIQSMPALHQGAMPSKQRQDRRALISERGDAADASSIQNASLPYMPVKRPSSTKKMIMSEPPAHDPPPPPAPAVMIPRARLHPHHGDSRENISRKRSLELSSEAKLISYLESGASANHEEMRRKHSLESSYSANKDRHNKQGALVSAGFKVSTTIRGDEVLKDDRDDLSSINKGESDGDIGRFDSLRKSYR
ncbi:hypothetical protein O3G_MSEX014321 [Manduca sexta]|uniref:EGF-like domain-containing protein n=1 Tax=Manduca sexta TaxID=7130 RepID=A0A921ZUD7_MANSE|nr:hypothetical protein O3G_MSEX014321 [Manduca sexta]